jgi:hypothetical protein
MRSGTRRIVWKRRHAGGARIFRDADDEDLCAAVTVTARRARIHRRTHDRERANVAIRSLVRRSRRERPWIGCVLNRHLGFDARSRRPADGRSRVETRPRRAISSPSRSQGDVAGPPRPTRPRPRPVSFQGPRGWTERRETKGPKGPTVFAIVVSIASTPPEQTRDERRARRTRARARASRRGARDCA